ncbi:hypothetical protein GOODEAATRI_002352 [Goodea atripinnis]|uniref:PHD-type domain-containing protein n=1 Tax=Goodea atripinnis TaxID=208336 RepID=A0ABV0NHX4_9TELE
METDWSNSSSQGDIHEDFCTVCRRSGQLLMCDTCSRVYHLDCLDPPLKTIPKGMWICPKCQDQILKKEEAIPWPGTLAIVHSYIAYKEGESTFCRVSSWKHGGLMVSLLCVSAKEEEKQKLMKWSSELKVEREQLEQRVKQLSNSITKCMETKNTILARQKEMQLSLDKVKHLIRLIQAFNFNQALAETEEKDVRVQDRAPAVLGCGAAAEVSSMEKQVVSCSLPRPETEAVPVAPATVATTNGTTEPPCPAHSPAAAENKIAAVNPAETAVEKKQEELSDGSNNSKTSEPSQHSLPALLSSLDDKK